MNAEQKQHFHLSLGRLLLVLSMIGFLWGLLPIGGMTLPHWLEYVLAIPFGKSAVIFSVLVCVCFTLGLLELDRGRRRL